MKQGLSLISKIYEKGNRFITDELKKNGAEGLVPSHGDILACLYKQDKISMKDIADKIHRTRPTVTVLVDKLEKFGFVERIVSDKDNRYTYISLTKKGNEFKQSFEKISNDLNNMLYKNLTDKEAETLDNLLLKMLNDKG